MAPGKPPSFLSRFNPVPSFPEYSGPYKVGTVDVEIPVSDLLSPSPAPENAGDIETVQFRIFYPATSDAKGKRIPWLPAPQRHTLSAYIQFLGAGSAVAEAVSFLPRHLHYTTIPVVKNAPVHTPNTPNQRWPTVIFSHGLGSNRNTYSQIAGGLASYGTVVICPEHRDGSAIASFIRIPSAQDRFFYKNTRRVVPYQRIPHDATDEVHVLRDAQLRIRLWEMGLIHDAILKLDSGVAFTNLNTSTPSLNQFTGTLHVHEPGSIIFSGHSFGAATVVQFLKSVYYAHVPSVAGMKFFYKPRLDSCVRKQVTQENVTIVLDMWCFPLLSKQTSELFALPLPAYDDTPSSPGGTAILAVESDHFFKWKEHLHAKARILSPEPTAKKVTAKCFERPSGIRLPEPQFFYVKNSAHLNQSDFGLLFPWLTKKVFGSDLPERAIRLNLRAILQTFRVNNVPVGRTWVGDLVEGACPEKEIANDGAESASDAEGAAETVMTAPHQEAKDGVDDDKAIFDRSGKLVEAWVWIDTIGLGEYADKTVDTDQTKTELTEPEMASEIEPHLSKVATHETGTKVQQVQSR